jgi:hypothetical protein
LISKIFFRKKIRGKITAVMHWPRSLMESCGTTIENKKRSART